MHSCKIADKTPQQVYLSGTQCNFGVIGFVQCSQLLKYALHVICETWLTTTEVILQSAKHTHDVLVAIFYSTWTIYKELSFENQMQTITWH